jgi:NTE family protein
MAAAAQRGARVTTQGARQVSGKTINLALQGGGAHGAFTWGVLDRLLQDERIAIEGIAATSAGAMNATVFAYGLTVGGRQAARSALTEFWRRVSKVACWSPLQPSLFDLWLGDDSLSRSPAFVMFDLMARVLSPYEFNPWNWNPLGVVLNDSVDFNGLRESAGGTKLFLCATNVRTGKLKIFSGREITADAVLASACLPFLAQAVEIDGEAYWDGGYMGNPAIFPLIYECQSRDVLIVHINPLKRQEIPKSAADILNRIHEISFNSSLMREMRAISFVSRLIDEQKINDGSLRKILIHSIFADDVTSRLGVASKYNASWRFLTRLRDVGRASAEAWLAANYDHLGHQSTVDLPAVFL